MEHFKAVQEGKGELMAGQALWLQRHDKSLLREGKERVSWNPEEELRHLKKEITPLIEYVEALKEQLEPAQRVLLKFLQKKWALERQLTVPTLVGARRRGKRKKEKVTFTEEELRLLLKHAPKEKGEER